MDFNTNEAWVTISKPTFFLGEEKTSYTPSYMYLGVTFTWPQFSLWQDICARFSRGYAALGAFKRQCEGMQFQMPQTKPWLFDTLLSLTLLYGIETWGLSVTKTNN